MVESITRKSASRTPGDPIYHSAAVYMDIYHYTAPPSFSSVIDHILLLLPDFAHSLLRRNSFIRVCFGMFRTFAFYQNARYARSPTPIGYLQVLQAFVSFWSSNIFHHPLHNTLEKNTSIFQHLLRTFSPSYHFTILYFSSYSSFLECCTYLSVS